MDQPSKEVVRNSEYLEQLIAERKNVTPDNVHTMRLLDIEIEKERNSTLPPGAIAEPFAVDLFSDSKDNRIRVALKVAIPKDSFNYVGKIIGPNGCNHKMLKNTTRCKVMVYGKGSMRDDAKEATLLHSGDNKFSHLAQQLHVNIETFGNPVQAYNNMLLGIDGVKNLLVPDSYPQSGGGSYNSNRGGGYSGRGRGGAAATDSSTQSTYYNQTSTAYGYTEKEDPYAAQYSNMQQYDSQQVYDGYSTSYMPQSQTQQQSFGSSQHHNTATRPHRGGRGRGGNRGGNQRGGGSQRGGVNQRYNPY